MYKGVAFSLNINRQLFYYIFSLLATIGLSILDSEPSFIGCYLLPVVNFYLSYSGHTPEFNPPLLYMQTTLTSLVDNMHSQTFN